MKFPLYSLEEDTADYGYSDGEGELGVGGAPDIAAGVQAAGVEVEGGGLGEKPVTGEKEQTEKEIDGIGGPVVAGTCITGPQQFPQFPDNLLTSAPPEYLVVVKKR